MKAVAYFLLSGVAALTAGATASLFFPLRYKLASWIAVTVICAIACGITYKPWKGRHDR